MTPEAQAALDYLKQNGQAIHEAIVTHEGDMRVWIDDLLLSYPHIRGLAALERMKASVQCVNSWTLTEMVVACSKLADSGKLDLQTANEARAVKHQWTVLVQSATPRAASAAEAASIDRQAKALADRAVGLLST